MIILTTHLKENNIKCQTIVKKENPIRIQSRDSFSVTNEKITELEKEIQKLQGIIKDLENKKPKDESKQSEKKFRQLYELSPLGIAQYDTSGNYIYANPAYCKIFKRSLDELVGNNLLDIKILPEKVEDERVFMKNLVDNQPDLKEFERENIRGDGKIIHVKYNADYYRNDKDELQGFIVFCEDITEKRISVQKLIDAQKLDTIGSLAGGVADDFNNMLAGIIGYASVLLKEETNPNKQSDLNGILDSARNASELTQKLLAFGKRGKHLVKPIDLNEEIKRVLELLRRSFDKSIIMEHELQEDIYTIEADPSQIDQVLMNICVNAIEAMPDGGLLIVTSENVVVTSLDKELISQINPGKYVKLTIEDTGYGISEEIRGQLYEPFFTTKKEGKIRGTGLGLSTVYGIVLTHNGLLDFTSEVDVGTKFTIYFPKGGKSLSYKKTMMVEDSKPKGTILVVDDEELIRVVVKKMIEQLGYNVILANDGGQAVEVFKNHQKTINGVLLDMRMPRINGREAFIRMKEIDPDIKVILCTGYGFTEEVKEMISLGVIGLLSKPYQINTLSEWLKMLMK